MPKANPKVELLPSADESPLDRLAAVVAAKLGMAAPLRAEHQGRSVRELSEEVLLEPWFLPREISATILRLLPLPHRRKFQRYFEKWGCIKCGRKDVPYASCGFCDRCYSRLAARLRQCFVAGDGESQEPSAEEQIAALLPAAAETLFGTRKALGNGRSNDE